MTVGTLVLPSPFGPLTLFADQNQIVALDWGQGTVMPGTIPEVLTDAKAQLAAYFDGRLKVFDLPLAPRGTPYQRRVWDCLRGIPFGETRTYGDIAKTIGSAPRAIGGACGANPIPILIPCHRVLGTNGALGGYSGDGGIATKATLLRHEGAAFTGPQA